MIPPRVPEEIKSITCSPHPLSRGNLSTSYCVDVNYTCNTSMGRENIQYKLYFKMSVLEGHGQEIAIEAQLMEKEVETLLRLYPRVRKMIEEKKIEAEVNLPLPEIVYGSYSSSGEGVIVAMDMLEEGYSRPDYRMGLSLTTMVATVESLAKIHATSAVFMAQEGQEEFVREFPHLERSFYESEAVFKHTSRLLKVIQVNQAGSDQDFFRSFLTLSGVFRAFSLSTSSWSCGGLVLGTFSLPPSTEDLVFLLHSSVSPTVTCLRRAS